MDKSWRYNNCKQTEVGKVWADKNGKVWADKNGRGNWIITECGNRLFFIDSDPTRINGCLCPKCGKTVVVDTRLFDAINEASEESEE